MMRTRTEKALDRRRAILEAATALFAEHGAWATPTSAISRAAGIAEGTLFVHFKTKDALINALYLLLKSELAQSVLTPVQGAFPAAAGIRESLKVLWDGYLRWALAHPAKYKVLGQLQASPSLTIETRREAARPFAGLEARIRAAVGAGELRPLSFGFLAALLVAMTDATWAYVMEHPEERETALETGFETLWGGVAAERS